MSLESFSHILAFLSALTCTLCHHTYMHASSSIIYSQVKGFCLFLSLN